MPKRQRTEAIKTRRLKKADFEVDFFFMNEVEYSPLGETLDGASKHLRWRNYVNDFFCMNFGIWLPYYMTAGNAILLALRSRKSTEFSCISDTVILENNR